MSTETQTSHFRFHESDGLSRIMRAWMTEDRWREAYDLLVTGLMPSTDDSKAIDIHALAVDILEGRTVLNTLPSGQVEPGEPVDDEEMEHHRDLVTFVYGGRIKIDGRWWRPCGRITQMGKDSAAAAGPAPARLPGSPAIEQWNRRRAEYYAYDGERIELVGDAFIVLEPVGDPPTWSKPATSVVDAVAECEMVGRGLVERGERWPSATVEARVMIRTSNIMDDERSEIECLAAEVDDEAFAANIEVWRAKIREQAGSDVFELHCDDGRTLTVPRAPFVRWALRDEGVELPPWDSVTPSGTKMQNDNPDHTDWVLGAGVPLEDAYATKGPGRIMNAAAWDEATRLQREYRAPSVPRGILAALDSMRSGSHEAAVIVKGPAYTGRVGDGVVVLPDLSPLRVAELSDAHAVISELGGETCHLAIVSRGQGIPVVRVKDACKIFADGACVKVDAAVGRVTIFDD